MKLIMENWRKFSEEEEEERSELDKIKEIFVSNGVQAIELGEMLIPDEPEIRDMKRLVDSVRDFLKLLENPAPLYTDRIATGRAWNKEVVAMINDIFATSGEGRRGLEGPGGYIIVMLQKPTTLYQNMQGIIGFGNLPKWMP